jgi:hypothetical protein
MSQIQSLAQLDTEIEVKSPAMICPELTVTYEGFSSGNPMNKANLTVATSSHVNMVGEPTLNQNVYNSKISIGPDNVKTFSNARNEEHEIETPSTSIKESNKKNTAESLEMKEKILSENMLNEEQRLGAVSKL